MELPTDPTGSTQPSVSDQILWAILQLTKNQDTLQKQVVDMAMQMTQKTRVIDPETPARNEMRVHGGRARPRASAEDIPLMGGLGGCAPPPQFAEVPNGGQDRPIEVVGEQFDEDKTEVEWYTPTILSRTLHVVVNKSASIRNQHPNQQDVPPQQQVDLPIQALQAQVTALLNNKTPNYKTRLA